MQTDIILEGKLDDFLKVQEEQAYDNFTLNIIMAHVNIILAGMFLLFFDDDQYDDDESKDENESIVHAAEILCDERDLFIENVYSDVCEYYESLKLKVPDKGLVRSYISKLVKEGKIQTILKKLKLIIAIKNSSETDVKIGVNQEEYLLGD